MAKTGRTIWVIGLGVGLVGLIAFAWWKIEARRFAAAFDEVRQQMDIRKQFDQPRRWLAQVPANWSNDPEVIYRLGVCEHVAGDLPAALKTWSRVDMDLDSHFVIRAGLARARTLVGNLGRFSEGEELLTAFMAVKGTAKDRDEVRHTLGELLFWQGRRDDVRRLIEGGFRSATDPIGEIVYHWMAENAVVLVEIVRGEVENAAKLDPNDDRVWLAQARLAMLDGRFDEASKTLDRCQQKRPEDPAVWRTRLDLARGRDDVAAVRVALTHLPAARFTDDERFELAAWLAGQRRDLTAERNLLEQWVAAAPGESRALDRLATLTWDIGKQDKARSYRKRKAEIDTAKDRYRYLIDGKIDAPLFAEMGTLSETLGRRFEALGWWTLRQAFAPSNPVAHDALVRLRALPEPAKLDPGVMLATLLSEVDPDPKVAAKTGSGRSPIASSIVPKYSDDARKAGLNFLYDNGRSPLRLIPETTGGGVGIIDYDGDGWFDVYVVQGGTFPPRADQPNTGDRLFRNKGDGTFEDATQRSGIAKMPRGYGHGVTVGDIDNDGRSDLFITRWHGYALYRNKGDGTFEDITEKAGLGGNRDWPTSAAFADLDNDGDLDLYVAHYLPFDTEHPLLCDRKTTSKGNKLVDPTQKYNYCTPRLFGALPDHLFRNDGGRFVDVTAEAGIVDKEGRGLGVVAVDVDDDGLLDLFVANDTTANYLWHNLGGLKFEEVGTSNGIACNADGAFQAGMGTACGDLDGDGRIDLFVTNFYGESTTFFRNLGGGMFGDQTAAVGLAGPSRFLLGFGIVTFDANNDGRLDLATADGHVNDDRPDYPYDMPTLLLIGGEDGRFVDVTQAAGEPFTVPRVSRALASCDLDNDGKIDLVIIPQQSDLGYFHNKTESGHFVGFSLEGTKSNRDAIGAVVTITSGGREKRAWRYGGGSFQSTSDPRIHFGLGKETKVDKVEVRWPSGRVDRFGPVEGNRSYHLKEGASLPLSVGARG